MGSVWNTEGRRQRVFWGQRSLIGETHDHHVINVSVTFYWSRGFQPVGRGCCKRAPSRITGKTLYDFNDITWHWYSKVIPINKNLYYTGSIERRWEIINRFINTMNVGCQVKWSDGWAANAFEIFKWTLIPKSIGEYWTSQNDMKAMPLHFCLLTFTSYNFFIYKMFLSRVTKTLCLQQ